MRVLLVEDDPAISRFLTKGLREEQYVVDLVEDGTRAESQAAVEQYDVILLDLMLPGLDGLEVCRRLRAQGIDTPILVVTARDAVADRVVGLDAGADDYLVKPFAYDELVARLRALTRRGRTRTLSALLHYGPIEVHQEDHVAWVAGHRLDLTATEYRLLEYLVHRAESIVTREQLADHVWGTNGEQGSNVIDVYVSYLRRKLAGAGADGLIQTVRGMGYMLKAAEAGGPRAPEPATAGSRA